MILAGWFPDLSGWRVYVAGAPGFVTACAAAARACGARPGRVYTEEFFTEPRPWGAAQPAEGACIVTRSRIYTKTGDDGTTGLLHGGRVSKGDELVDAYGDIDEAVAALGAARAAGLEPRLSGRCSGCNGSSSRSPRTWRPARGSAAAWSPGSPWSLQR